MNTKNKKELIYDELVALAVCFGQKPDIERLTLYTNNLSQYPTADVLRSIREIMSSSKFFPSLSEIIEVINQHGEGPINERAISVASEIIGCISRFGNYRVNEVKEYLGSNFEIVERSGGWDNLCKISYEEIPSTRAQLREIAKAYFNMKIRKSDPNLKQLESGLDEARRLIEEKGIV